MKREVYDLKGFYFYHDKQHELSGKISIGTKGYVSGTLWDSNPNVSVNTRKIRGKLSTLEGKQVLGFLMKIPGERSLHIYYELAKKPDPVSGTYYGSWASREKNLEAQVLGEAPRIIKTTKKGRAAQFTLKKVK